MKRNYSENIGHLFIIILMVVSCVMTLYPFWHVVMYSLSDSKAALSGGIFLWPRGFSLLQYRVLLRSNNMLVSFLNSVLRVGIGVPFNIIMTASFAYVLANKKVVGRRAMSTLVFITMLFNGGLIPNFLLIHSLGLYNTRWALILPGAISAYNMFVMKSYFLSIPAEVEESAKLDGAGPFRTLIQIILPLSLPVIAAISMFYGVEHWNSFFDGIIYIESTRLQVFQVFLRSMMLQSSFQQLAGIDNFSDLSGLNEESVKMAAITLSVIPILMVYPFLQKYYIKGLMIGSIKA